MPTCVHCKTEETQLYQNGVPICLQCADAYEAKTKQGTREWAAAVNGNGQPNTLGAPAEDKQRT